MKEKSSGITIQRDGSIYFLICEDCMEEQIFDRPPKKAEIIEFNYFHRKCKSRVKTLI